MRYVYELYADGEPFHTDAVEAATEIEARAHAESIGWDMLATDDHEGFDSIDLQVVITK